MRTEAMSAQTRLALDVVCKHDRDGVIEEQRATIAKQAQEIAMLKNGIQIFAGGFPIYRGATLVGGIGVSGDGVEQDDMIGFLAVANAGRSLGTGLGHASPSIRADTLLPQGQRLTYVQCPVAPFNNSDAQDVCAGI